MQSFDKYDNFLKAYESIKTSNSEILKQIKDKSLSRIEGNILKSLIELMNDKPKKAIELLDKTTVTEEFLKGFYYLSYGLVYNHMSDLQNSSNYLLKSVKVFDELKAHDFIYKPIGALSYVCFNMRDLTMLESSYKLFRKYYFENDSHRFIKSDYLILLAILRDESKEALKLIDHRLNDLDIGTERNTKAYAILRIMCFIQLKDYDRCYEYLVEQKKMTGLKAKNNYAYILNLLNMITKKAPIYIYKRDFDTNHYLYLQLKVVQQLFLGNTEAALDYWKELQGILPKLYDDNFQYNFKHDIFSIALNSVKTNLVIHDSELDMIQIDNIKSNIDKLDYILSHSDKYISKDKLIQLIWKEDWTPKNYDRLRSLILRYKKREKEIKLVVRDGKYKKVA